VKDAPLSDKIHHHVKVQKMLTKFRGLNIKKFWRDVRFLKWSGQLIFLILLVSGFFYIFNTGVRNLEKTNLPFSWGWLGDTPGVSISEGFAPLPNSGRQMLQVGMYNMLRITLSGVVAATFIGTILGVARLSKNWIVEKASTGLLEIVRNIPLLVQMLFFQYFILTYPPLREADRGDIIAHVSAKGIAYPWPQPQEASWLFASFVILSFLVSRWIFKWRIKILEREGKDTHPFIWSLTVLGALLLVGWSGGYKAMGVIGIVSTLLSQLFEAVPAIAYQTLFAACFLLYGYRYIRKQISKSNTGELGGILSDEDYFRMAGSGVLVIVIAVLMFLPFGSRVGEFLEGDEIFYKADWGVSQYFTGIASKFDMSFSGAPYEVSYPKIVQVRDTKFTRYSKDHGKVTTVGYFATWLGVVLYTSIFISEVVRSGIMAVSKGQSEAGLSLGLRPRSLLRLVILPQAFRVMLPPMGNQYLNLAKNTSLGIAVAYPEIVAVGQTLYNQEGQTMPVFVIWMGFYSFISLTISGIINFYNRRFALVER